MFVSYAQGTSYLRGCKERLIVDFFCRFDEQEDRFGEDDHCLDRREDRLSDRDVGDRDDCFGERDSRLDERDDRSAKQYDRSSEDRFGVDEFSSVVFKFELKSAVAFNSSIDCENCCVRATKFPFCVQFSRTLSLTS